MKAIFALLLSSIVTIIFSSCQKEVDGVILNSNDADSVITRIVILDTTYSSGVDTVQIVDFAYDASGRLSKYNGVYYTLGMSGTGKIEGEDELVYIYSGAEAHPGILKEKYTSYLPTLTTDYTNSYLTYTDGYVSKDSCAREGSWYETKFFNKLSPTRVKVVTATGNFIGFRSFDTSYVQLEFQNGDLIKETDSLYMPGGTWNVVSLTTLYDTKTNPFKPFSVPYLAPFFQHHPIDIGISEFFVPSEHNILKQTSERGFVEALNYYDYGATGLPKIARNETSSKVFFFYKKP